MDSSVTFSLSHDGLLLRRLTGDARSGGSKRRLEDGLGKSEERSIISREVEASDSEVIRDLGFV